MKFRLVIGRLVMAFSMAVFGLEHIEAQEHVESPIHRIALLGCIRQNEAVPALEKYPKLNADLHLWVGDNVYADAEDDPKVIRDSYRKLAAKPGFEELRRVGQHMMTWDDHDFGLNNAGRHYRLKEESLHAFIEFWELENIIPRDQQGVYNARILGPEGKRLQVIMLDVRYHRDDPGPQADVLGETQWEWLREQLKEPADLRLIVSGFQVLLPEEAGSETWDQFPAARSRLFETIREAGAERVVFITGDQHYGEACRLKNGLDFDVVELQFAGLNQIEAPEYNPLRVSTVCASQHSYAYIDVQWEASQEEPPHLLFQVRNAETDEMEVLYRVNFSEIELRVDFSSPNRFVDVHRIEIDHDHPLLELRFTTDSDLPLDQWQVYDGPLELSETTRVLAGLFLPNGHLRSRVFSKTFTRLQPLASVKRTSRKPGLRFAYYEGDFDTQPDFRQLNPETEGVTDELDIENVAKRDDHYGIVFEGYIEVPVQGLYEFAVRSDDGALLWLHDQLVVDNGGSHSTRTRTGRVALASGIHPFRLEYFEDYLGQSLELKVVRIDAQGRQEVDCKFTCDE